MALSVGLQGTATWLECRIHIGEEAKARGVCCCHFKGEVFEGSSFYPILRDLESLNGIRRWEPFNVFGQRLYRMKVLIDQKITWILYQLSLETLPQ